MNKTLPAPVAHARAFAVAAHGDQKYGDQPYVSHLDAVDDVLISAGYADDLELRQVGYLHDVIEDTGETAGSLTEAGFSTDVVLGASFTTDAEGHNRKTRKAATYARMRRDVNKLTSETLDLAAYRWIAMGVRAKLADRISNYSTALADNLGLADMYYKERDSFRAALTVEGVADAMWVEYEKLAATRPPKPRRR